MGPGTASPRIISQYRHVKMRHRDNLYASYLTTRNADEASISRCTPHKRALSRMAAVPPFFVEAACMARSNRVLSEAGGSARWRFSRWAMERCAASRGLDGPG